MNANKHNIMIVIAAFGLIGYVLSFATLTYVMSAVQTNTNISNTGSITAVGLGVYSDAGLTTKISSISWGVLSPGSNVNKTVYLRNEGNAPVTLALATSNWNPSTASNYLTLTWNYDGQTLNVNAVVQVKFTLSAKSTTTGLTNFSFDMAITGIAQ